MYIYLVGHISKTGNITNSHRDDILVTVTKDLSTKKNTEVLNNISGTNLPMKCEP